MLRSRGQHVTASARPESKIETVERRAERDGDIASIPFERGLPVSLLRAREAVMFHMRPVLRSFGTTEQQWRVLRSLDIAEPMDKTTLADRSTLLMPSLLRILKDLKGESLIRFVRSTSNARLSGVALTAKGAAHVATVAAAIHDKSQILKATIGEDTVEQLLTLLRVVEVRLTALRQHQSEVR